MDIFMGQLFRRVFSSSPLILVDVGASGGLNDNWKKAGKHLEVIGFEPDERSYRALAAQGAPGRKYINKALHSGRETLDFHFTRQCQASSFLRPKMDFLRLFPDQGRYEVIRTARVEVDTLDAALKDSGTSDVDFIKIDAQGAELFILEGASVTLDNVLGLEIETGFVKTYEGQPLFSEVDPLVGKRGYQLFDIRPCYWKRAAGIKYGGLKGQLIFADVLYLADPGKLKAIVSSAGSEAGKTKVVKMMAISLLYGYADYAVSVFEENASLFSRTEREAFYAFMKRTVQLSWWIPAFPGKGRVGMLFRELYGLLRYSRDKWSVGQEKLGNF
jgi:FkbM family methyltransferase